MCLARGRTRLHDIFVLAGPVLEQALQNTPAITDLSPSSSDIGLASHVKAIYNARFVHQSEEEHPGHMQCWEHKWHSELQENRGREIGRYVTRSRWSYRSLEEKAMSLRVEFMQDASPRGGSRISAA